MDTGRPDPIPRHHPGLKRLIPLTELRHLYRLLRQTLVSTAAHLQVAEEVRRDPAKFQGVVERSREHFALYDNRDEGFHPRGAVGTLSPGVCQSPKPVHQLLRRVERHGLQFPVDRELDADFVDYELSPVRTTASEYETGVRSMAGGGVDLLLANGVDRLPVVVEAKGVTDRNLFLGLVQALTYAVEFSTPRQRERLGRTYPGRFAWQPEGPAVDIYLCLVGIPESRHHPKFLNLVDEICGRLLMPGSPVTGVVRRVVCVETDLAGTDLVPAAVIFRHDVGRTP